MRSSIADKAWPCECGHRKDWHTKYSKINATDFGECHWRRKRGGVLTHYCGCTSYKPIDNFKFVEYSREGKIAKPQVHKRLDALNGIIDWGDDEKNFLVSRFLDHK